MHSQPGISHAVGLLGATHAEQEHDLAVHLEVTSLKAISQVVPVRRECVSVVKCDPVGAVAHAFDCSYLYWGSVCLA